MTIRLTLSLVLTLALLSSSLIARACPTAETEGPMARQTPIHMRDLKDKYQSLKPGELILDVRTSEEYAAGHVPGAKNISHELVAQRAQELMSYELIYIYCRSGKRARAAASALNAQGMDRLILIQDSGMPEWIQAGYPIEKGAQ